MNEKRTPTESVPEGEQPPASGAKPRKRLERSRDDRYIGGVAAGIATYLGIDPILIRLAFVASILVGGIGVLVYLVLLAAVPIEGDPDVPPEPVEGRRRNLVIAGTVAVGILALFAVGGSGFTAWVFGFGPGVVFGIFAWLAAAGLTTLLLLAARDEPAPGAKASPSPGGPAAASGSTSGTESPSPSQPQKGRAPA
ncbi:MAG: PspC domain-containing protein, partial [Acidobacteriota bacterium]